MRTNLCLALLIVCAFTATTRASVLVNGGFETGPVIPNGFFEVLYATDTSIDGWVVTHGTIDYVADTFWRPAGGSRSIDLIGGTLGGIAQTFATTPGNLYEVSFMMAGNPGGYQTEDMYVKTMNVSAAGQSQNFDFNSFGHSFEDMGWESRLWSFTATDTSTELWFAMASPTYGHYGVVLDDVQVNVVPAPSSLTVLLGVGVMVFGMEWWKKRRRSVRATA
jgi:choice-of-anchor C domain-containing protein